MTVHSFLCYLSLHFPLTFSHSAHFKLPALCHSPVTQHADPEASPHLKRLSGAGAPCTSLHSPGSRAGSPAQLPCQTGGGVTEQAVNWGEKPMFNVTVKAALHSDYTKYHQLQIHRHRIKTYMQTIWIGARKPSWLLSDHFQNTDQQQWKSTVKTENARPFSAPS